MSDAQRLAVLRWTAAAQREEAAHRVWVAATGTERAARRAAQQAGRERRAARRRLERALGRPLTFAEMGTGDGA